MSLCSWTWTSLVLLSQPLLPFHGTEWLELSFSLPLGQLSSDPSRLGSTKVVSPEGRPCNLERKAFEHLKLLPCSFSCWKHHEFFSNMQCAIQVELLEVKLTKVPTYLPTSPHNWVLWTWTHRPVSVDPPAVCQLRFRFSHHDRHWFPWRFLLVGFYSSKLLFSVSACISSLTGQWFALWLIFVINQRGVVCFSACSAFTCC